MLMQMLKNLMIKIINANFVDFILWNNSASQDIIYLEGLDKVIYLNEFGNCWQKRDSSLLSKTSLTLGTWTNTTEQPPLNMVTLI